MVIVANRESLSKNLKKVKENKALHVQGFLFLP